MILPHKRKLEQHLKQRYGELFGAEFDVLLYDQSFNGSGVPNYLELVNFAYGLIIAKFPQ